MPGFTHLQSGAAGDARPSSDGLSRDAGPRPQPVRRRARAAERMPARRGGAGRDRLPDRPRCDRGGARLRPADRQQHRLRSATAISSSIISTPRRCARCICRGWPRRSSCGRRSRSASSRCPTPGRPDRRSCPTSATPTRPSWSAAIRRRIVGDLVALLVLLKGLPLAYAKDLQDDKAPLFDAHDLLC